jgi:SsrA-binding protein
MGYTLIPTKVYYKGNLVKIEIALAKGKKVHDKRQSLKEKDIKMHMDKAIKNRF